MSEVTEGEINELSYLFYSGIRWENLSPKQQDTFLRYQETRGHKIRDSKGHRVPYLPVA